MNTPSLLRGPLLAFAVSLVLVLAACDGLDPLVADAEAPGGTAAPTGPATGDDFNALEAALLAAPVTMTPGDLQAAQVSASADDVVCTGAIGAASIDGNVIVPDGARCTLTRTQIDGNVIVGTNAILIARGVAVGGNVQAEGHRGVLVRDDRGARAFVGGSVQLNQGGEAGVGRVDVDSDVQLEQNDGRIVLAQNRVDGNMQVNQNTGGVRIAQNAIQGALQCQANNPPPMGGGNQAGDKEDQCASL